MPAPWKESRFPMRMRGLLVGFEDWRMKTPTPTRTLGGGMVDGALGLFDFVMESDDGFL